MANLKDRYERLHPVSRAEWREWLAEHHVSATGVWLVSWKTATGKPKIAYGETVEEALCFGWIDSVANTLDDERSMQLFTPRKSGSPWSRLNKQRIEILTAAGLITPAGQAKIDAAKRDGSWNAYDAVEALEEPADLTAALAVNPLARGHCDGFSPSTKKQLLWWITSAKRPETRAKRIAELVLAAAENRNPIAYPRPKRS